MAVEIPESLEIRTITDDEVAAFRDAIMSAFGDDRDADPNGPERTRALLPRAQTWAAFDGTTIVATAATIDHGLIVPGGAVLPMAGLTAVMVRPTHRRRGLLRELMRRHQDDARARGFAIGGLWSSEASIYGRFGYGLATEGDVLEIPDARTLELAAPRELDELEWIDEPTARALLPAIYARSVALRPGALVRSDLWWRERRFLEAPFMRGGASLRRHVLARRGGTYVGYVQYRQRPGWSDGLPAGKLEIVELIAVDARAEATLWQLALHVDLFPHVSWWNAPVDDVLAWSVTNSRQIRRRRNDGLWLRVEDVAVALAARTFDGDGAVRFAVEDTTWELVVEGGHAVRCAPTTESAELVMSRATLGALYLGGVPASRLARANLIAGSPEALRRADRMFVSAVVPWCPELF